MILRVILGLIVLCVPSMSAADIFPNWADLDAYRKSWYSKHLAAAGESAIDMVQGQSTYRFTWLRTFHNPIIVRIQCESRCMLHAVRLTGAGGYEPGQIEAQLDREITDRELRKLERLLESTDFWSGQPDVTNMGYDGAQWIFEAAIDDTYLGWAVWSARNDERFADFAVLCLFMLELSDFAIPDREIY